MSKTLRMFSPAGPCLTCAGGAGLIVRETAKFWVVSERRGPKTHRVAKSNFRAHIEPCSSCTDHPKTQYPHGYMD